MSKKNLLVSRHFEEQLAQIDREHALLIICWLNKHLVNSPYTRKPGKRLLGKLSEVWRYRVAVIVSSVRWRKNSY